MQNGAIAVTIAHPNINAERSSLMPHLSQLDLAANPTARRVVKEETVKVEFAAVAGKLMSLEGPNRHAPGNAIVTGSGGERWVVSRERFDAKYVPQANLAHGEAGAYRNRPSIVLAKQMQEPFAIARTQNGDVLSGNAGDYGVLKAARFAKVYRNA
ncbi:hypothetical protein BRCH_01081c [Candidatus Burkholderia brachyanthoides]|nr:hypothetical protein BRCH_01081c [Candidatus Burkholderia brachyanthoides]